MPAVSAALKESGVTKLESAAANIPHAKVRGWKEPEVFDVAVSVGAVPPCTYVAAVAVSFHEVSAA